MSRSLEYPAGGSRRDLRLDLLRGLCLFKMVFNHLWTTPVHALQSWIGWVSAAEGFFLISGGVVGIVHGRRVHEQGLRRVSGHVLQRAFDLWVANLALVFLFVSLEAAGVVEARRFSYWATGGDWRELLRFDQPYFLQVLPRYVAFLAVTPLALWLLVTKRTLWLVLGSAGLWLAHYARPIAFRVPFLESSSPSFPLAAWQALFFLGMVLGYHREPVGTAWRRIPTWVWAVVLGGASVLFAVLRQVDGGGLFPLFGLTIHGAFARDSFGPLRWVNLAVVSGFVFLLVDRWWRPVARLAAPVLIPFGQHSLYLFLMHILLVRLVRAAAPWNPSGIAAVVLADTALVFLLWLAIRRRFLFGLVPN
jgi:hypothetical protein